MNNSVTTDEELHIFAGEAFKIILNSPKWPPALYDGTPVRSYCTLPIIYNTK